MENNQEEIIFVQKNKIFVSESLVIRHVEGEVAIVTNPSCTKIFHIQARICQDKITIKMTKREFVDSLLNLKVSSVHHCCEVSPYPYFLTLIGKNSPSVKYKAMTVGENNIALD